MTATLATAPTAKRYASTFEAVVILCPFCDSRDSHWQNRWRVCRECGCQWKLDYASTIFAKLFGS